MPSGTWLCREDKELYNIQIKTKGKVGYTTFETGAIIFSSSFQKSQNTKINLFYIYVS